MLLMDGWHVIRPEIMAAYQFIDLVLGVFTGIVSTVVRIGMGLGLTLGTFAKLDESIFPATFAFLDKGWMGFCSMITAEARNSNPIYLSFAAWLLTVRAMKTEVAYVGALRYQGITDGAVAKALKRPDHVKRLEDTERLLAEGDSIVFDSRAAGEDNANAVWIDVDTWDAAGGFGSAVVLNIARTWLRWMLDLPLTPWTEKEPAPAQLDAAAYLRGSKKRKIANRFWLLWMLHQNPSLRRVRKHRLFEEVVDADRAEMKPVDVPKSVETI